MRGLAETAQVFSIFKMVFDIPSHSVVSVSSTWKIRRSGSNVAIESHLGRTGMCVGLTLLWLKKSYAAPASIGIREYGNLGENPMFEASITHGAYIMFVKRYLKELNVQSFAELDYNLGTLFYKMDLRLSTQSLECQDRMGGQGLINPQQIAEWIASEPGHCYFEYVERSGEGHAIGIRYFTSVQIFDVNRGSVLESPVNAVFCIRAYLEMMVIENSIENFDGSWAVARVRSSID